MHVWKYAKIYLVLVQNGTCAQVPASLFRPYFIFLVVVQFLMYVCIHAYIHTEDHKYMHMYRHPHSLTHT